MSKQVTATGWALVDKNTGQLIQSRTFEVCEDPYRLRKPDFSGGSDSRSRNSSEGEIK